MNKTEEEMNEPGNENPNILWAKIFVDELARNGLSTVCIAPGSRSTPLTLAFHANNEITVYPHLDERSAAFFALGLALAEENPVALLCTSGTAAANFHPAIIEAQMSQVPLLIITADRPYELRHSGANQTIDQVKMFGDHVLWSVDLPLPQLEAPDLLLRNIRSLAARALARSNGLLKGPVHLNFPFRKPLEPRMANNGSHSLPGSSRQQPHTRFERGLLQPGADQVRNLREIINGHPRGLIICGPRSPKRDFFSAVIQMAAAAGYPILADPLSGVRFNPQIKSAIVLGGYESFLQDVKPSWPGPDLIIRFGTVPTSKWLNHYLVQSNAAFHIHVQESGAWADQDHTTTHFIQVNAASLCRQLIPAINRPADKKWQEQWLKIEEACWSVTVDFLDRKMFDGAVVAALLEQLPQDTKFFVGNSLAVRHVDQFGQPQNRPMEIFANRGASGIDGNISTGLGIAAASKEPTVLLLGDITFYHDSNGLLAIKQLGLDKVIIVLINNNGGGIFRRLPVAQIEPPFEKLFLTPHHLNFAPLATMYGLGYQLATDLPSFRSKFDAALTSDSAVIIEIQTDSEKDDQIRMQIISQISSQLKTIFIAE